MISAMSALGMTAPTCPIQRRFRSIRTHKPSSPKSRSQTQTSASVAARALSVVSNASPANKTNWREELIRIDHNISPKLRAMFRYIHDSWGDDNSDDTMELSDGCSFPTIQTQFKGPGTSTVFRLTCYGIANFAQ